MKFLIMSDLHLEFHRDGGDKFIRKSNRGKYDGIILAGDVTVSGKIESVT